MKKIICFLAIISFVISGCTIDNYPKEIEWEHKTYINTGNYYSEDEVSLILIGTYEDYNFYEENMEDKTINGMEVVYIDTSKYIKTDVGYLHYKPEDVLFK